jgi:DNA-binding CsgD family transcriptional regulator
VSLSKLIPMAKEIPSWINYMGGLQQRTFSKDELFIEGLDQIINIKSVTASVFNHSIPWIYLLDYTTGNYMVVSNSVTTMLGYKTEAFLKEGINFTFENYNPHHLKIFNEEIFPDRLKILKKISFKEHADYIFSYNFQFKNSKGEYLNLLQRNCFIKSDENNNPLISFGVITNVNHFKIENPVIQVIEKISKDGIQTTETFFKKSYFLNKEDSFFTKREKELLPLLADGLCSKEIADKLCISEFTVINHRRNMMLKTNSHNTTELISNALRNCIL